MKAMTKNRIKPFVNGKPPAPKPAPEPAKPDRLDDGRFQPGCKPGPGNPFAKRVAGLRKALLESVGEADVARLGRKLLDQALGGDVAAAKVLLGYIVGKPTEAIDPDRVELEAWKLILSWPTVAEAIAATWAVRPAAAADLIVEQAANTSEEVIKKAASPAPLEGSVRIIRRREEKGK